MANVWSNIGDALSGAGAIMQGREGEYRQLQEMKKDREYNRRERRRGEDRAAEIERQKTFFTDNLAALNLAKQGDWQGVSDIFTSRGNMAENFPGVDFTQTDELNAMSDRAAAGDPGAQNAITQVLTNNASVGQLAQRAVNGDEEARAKLETMTSRNVARGQAAGILGQDTAGQREWADRTSGLSDEQKKRAQLVDLGLRARKVGSAARTAKELGDAEEIAAAEATMAGGRESGKLRAQLKFKPKITSAVKLAEKKATARGETLTALNRSKAAMPGLNEAVGELRALASVATSTLGGRAFDALVKETGFGSTKGKTAKAKFVAIINNQVLPLLKETFGAAFTAQEGEALKATMGDADASPEEKLAQLDAFIAQKNRSIQTREAELGIDDAAPESSAGAVNWSDL